MFKDLFAAGCFGVHDGLTCRKGEDRKITSSSI